MHVAHSGIMWMAGNGEEMETDLHAKRLIVIPGSVEHNPSFI